MPDGVYAHVEALPYLSEELQAAVAAARLLAEIDGGGFQVVKFALRGWKLSLLSYPGFFEEAFPRSGGELDGRGERVPLRMRAGG